MKHIFPLMVSSLRQYRWYIQFKSKHTFPIYHPSIYLLQLELLHLIICYEVCLNITNYPIFNMQDFRYWLLYLHFGLFWYVGIPTVILIANKDTNNWSLSHTSAAFQVKTTSLHHICSYVTDLQLFSNPNSIPQPLAHILHITPNFISSQFCILSP